MGKNNQNMVNFSWKKITTVTHNNLTQTTAKYDNKSVENRCEKVNNKDFVEENPNLTTHIRTAAVVEPLFSTSTSTLTELHFVFFLIC